MNLEEWSDVHSFNIKKTITAVVTVIANLLLNLVSYEFTIRYFVSWIIISAYVIA